MAPGLSGVGGGQRLGLAGPGAPCSGRGRRVGWRGLVRLELDAEEPAKRGDRDDDAVPDADGREVELAAAEQLVGLAALRAVGDLAGRDEVSAHAQGAD